MCVVVGGAKFIEKDFSSLLERVFSPATGPQETKVKFQNSGNVGKLTFQIS